MHGCCAAKSRKIWRCMSDYFYKKDCFLREFEKIFIERRNVRSPAQSLHHGLHRGGSHASFAAVCPLRDAICELFSFCRCGHVWRGRCMPRFVHETRFSYGEKCRLARSFFAGVRHLQRHKRQVRRHRDSNRRRIQYERRS